MANTQQQLNELAALAYVSSIPLLWFESYPDKKGRIRGLMEKLQSQCNSLIQTYPEMTDSEKDMIIRNMTGYAASVALDGVDVHICLLTSMCIRMVVDTFDSRKVNSKAVADLISTMNSISEHFERYEQVDDLYTKGYEYAGKNWLCAESV